MDGGKYSIFKKALYPTTASDNPVITHILRIEHVSTRAVCATHYSPVQDSEYGLNINPITRSVAST